MTSVPPPWRTLVPDGEKAFLIGQQPWRSFCIEASDERSLQALPRHVAQLWEDGCTLVSGALPYEAGYALQGLDTPGDKTPALAVIHGYRQVERISLAALASLMRDAALETGFQPDSRRADYRASVQRIKAYLRAGDCYQVNLAQRLTARYTGDPLALWHRIARAHQPPFSGYIEGPTGAVLSLSPERFLRIRGRQVLTEPIKGSRPRGCTPARDRQLGEALRHSAKDQAENLMIVDLLRNDLGMICQAGSIAVPELFRLRRFSNVQHLVSRVTGNLRHGIPPLEALISCFPGGSITGAPKKRAMQIIAELEPVPRGFYCGSLFWQKAPDHLDSSILIRTLQTTPEGAIFCHGGGGIVADSDPEAEYEESLFKVRALMEAVGAGR